MKQKYVLTAVAVVAVGAVALGTVPMWEGMNSVKQEETRTSIIEEPVNTETEVTGTPTPLPTTAPVTGISFALFSHSPNIPYNVILTQFCFRTVICCCPVCAFYMQTGTQNSAP